MVDVRIKPMEWRGTEGVWAKADALFGATYRITEYAGMAKPFKLETVGFVGPNGHYGTLDDAKAAAQADYERRIRSTLSNAVAEREAEPVATVAGIVPDHCTGKSLVFCDGVLHVNKDGSGYILVKEDDFQIESDHDEDGVRSDFWITRFPAAEVQSLRDFLNGVPLTPPISELEALRKEIESAVVAERESCAFAVECHSGFGDHETIEACAQIVRDRSDPALRSDSIHLTPERYAELEAAEARLAELEKGLRARAPKFSSARDYKIQHMNGVDAYKLGWNAALRTARRVREGGKVDG